MFNFFRKTTSAVPAEADRPSSSNEQLQLRTPSPSVTSAIGTRFQRMDGNIDRSSPLREDHVGAPPDTPSPPSHNLDNELGLITDPSALYELISSVPAKTLHEYTLTHLIPPSAESKRGTQQPVLAHIHAPSSITLTHLTSFFSSLTPPPRLHCVRCHKFYYDVENTNRSCLVAHDDESAEVERVGVGKGDSGTQYETLWGCCGKTVEGDGDMGPPDGWCYEGKHTTDTKRARFRADSTIHDDKLASCKRLKCSEPKKQVEDDDSSDASSDRPSRSRPRKRRATATSGTTTSAAAASRKRARKADDDGEQEREQVEAEVEEDPNFTSPGSPGKGKGKGKGQAEVDDEAQGKASPSLAASTVKKQRQRKKRPRTTEDDKAFKPEGTPLGDELDDMDVDMDETASVASKSKRKPRTKNPTNPKTKSKSITRKETMVSDAAEAPAGSAPMSPPKSISVPGSPTLSVRAGGAKGSKSAAKPKSSIGVPVRKTKKLDEVIASSIDGEL